MTRPRAWLHALGLLLACSMSFAQVTAIRAGAVVAPDTATLATDQTILVEGGKITAIGRDLAIPPSANVIDLSGQTVLPGLMDAHTHLTAAIDPKWDLETLDHDAAAARRLPGHSRRAPREGGAGGGLHHRA
jgi:imidazolonepropionase-like amidohydrolase